jgi:glycosyltransferase involved in cell wall biosynthesis
MSDKKRIAVFTRYLTVGGLQRVMMRVANELAKRGYPVDLVLAKGLGPLANEVRSDVRVVNLDNNHVWASLPGLLRYLEEASPAVMLSGEVPSNLVAMWARLLTSADTKFVVSVHQNTTLHAQTAAIWYRKLIPYLIRIFYPAAHHVVTVSEGIGEDLKQLSPRLKSKTQVVHNPVIDQEIFQKAKAPVSHPWLADEEVPVILGVGRLSREKNFDLLLRAFAKVCAVRDARLMLLGDGPKREHLERLVNKLQIEDQVDMLGFVDNPYPYMADASLLVVSSIFEGLPTVIIEALACGCPVVSTDCPSGPREILGDGTWGELAPVDDEEALADAMLDSLAGSHDPNQLQERAWDFSVEKSIDRYLNLFFPDGAQA